MRNHVANSSGLYNESTVESRALVVTFITAVEMVRSPPDEETCSFRGWELRRWNFQQMKSELKSALPLIESVVPNRFRKKSSG